MTTVVIPWRPVDQHRAAALAFVEAHYAEHHPEWPVVLAELDEGAPWSKGAAVGAAMRSIAWDDVTVIADADVFVAPSALDRSVAAVSDGVPWARPHRLVHRLSPESTSTVLAGSDPVGLPLSSDNMRDSRPYRGYDGGGITVIRRSTYHDVPIDLRFEGWGHEDESWGEALRTLIAHPLRGHGDLWHLWHPPQARSSRSSGSIASIELRRRYERARKRREDMRALVNETKALVTS